MAASVRSLSLRVRVLGPALLVVLLAGSSAFAARTVDRDERVAAQAAIERVYAAHRIWPEGNPGRRPVTEKVLREPFLRTRVESYLRDSEELASRGCPITAAELQAEVERMAANTRSPGVLRELFAALGDDPLLVAETLARRTLVRRLLRSADPCGADARAVSPAIRGGPGDDEAGLFRLPSPAGEACTDDTWAEVAAGPGVPEGRRDHTVIWTGAEMIVWGGSIAADPFFTNTGGRYDPATDTWTPTSTDGAVPGPRGFHTAVWTGTEMIVWGGTASFQALYGTGGRYDPATDTWSPVSTGEHAPQPRKQHTAVWTGTEMIVWGGDDWPTFFNSGGRYDPAADAWTPTSVETGVPSPRSDHTAIWTGREMIVWGGQDGTYLNTPGGRYNPAADAWRPTTGSGAPTGRYLHSAIWTGREMIIWGGITGPQMVTNTGGLYDPGADRWLATATGAGVPLGRSGHSAVWTGAGMIIWGGSEGTGGQMESGGRYEPVADAWTPTSSDGGVPIARAYPEAVWTGSEMLVWGGRGAWTGWSWDFPITMARYCAVPGCDVRTFFSDDDGDGHGIASDIVLACTVPSGYAVLGDDCLDADRFVWAAPREVTGLLVSGAGEAVWLGWISQSDSAGPATVYDIVGGAVGDLRSTGGFADAACLAYGAPDEAWEDRGPDPLPGAAFYYLVRSRNACAGAGYGDSTLTPDPRDALDTGDPCR